MKAESDQDQERHDSRPLTYPSGVSVWDKHSCLDTILLLAVSTKGHISVASTANLYSQIERLCVFSLHNSEARLVNVLQPVLLASSPVCKETYFLAFYKALRLNGDPKASYRHKRLKESKSGH